MKAKDSVKVSGSDFWIVVELMKLMMDSDLKYLMKDSYSSLVTLTFLFFPAVFVVNLISVVKSFVLDYLDPGASSYWFVAVSFGSSPYSHHSLHSPSNLRQHYSSTDLYSLIFAIDAAHPAEELEIVDRRYCWWWHYLLVLDSNSLYC